MSRHKQKKIQAPIVATEPVVTAVPPGPTINFGFLPDALFIGSLVIAYAAIVGSVLKMVDRGLVVSIIQVLSIMLLVWIFYRGYAVPLE